MLIRLENGELAQYPDELGALVLADPGEGDVPDFPPDLVNCLIHDALVTMFDPSLTLAQNIANTQAYYAGGEVPSEANMKKARELIENYNKTISPEDVGCLDSDLMRYLYFTHDTNNTAQSMIIEQPSISKTQSAMLPDTTQHAEKKV